MGIIPTHVTADEPIIGAAATVLVLDFPTVGDQAAVERTVKRTMTFKKQCSPFPTPSRLRSPISVGCMSHCA